MLGKMIEEQMEPIRLDLEKLALNFNNVIHENLFNIKLRVLKPDSLGIESKPGIIRVNVLVEAPVKVSLEFGIKGMVTVRFGKRDVDYDFYTLTVTYKVGLWLQNEKMVNMISDIITSLVVMLDRMVYAKLNVM
jgi:hypothetical protein